MGPFSLFPLPYLLVWVQKPMLNLVQSLHKYSFSPWTILLTQAHWGILHFYFEVEVIRVHLFLMEREGVSQVDIKMSANVSRIENVDIVSPMYMLGQWSLFMGYAPRMRNYLCMNDIKVALALRGEKAN